MIRVTLFSLAVLLLGGVLAWAQDYYLGAYPSYHASTAGESYARGMADVARSQGQYNLATSEAAINLTEAQRNYIQNRDEWTNTYFQMREANREYRAAERRPRPSMESLVRYAQAGKPARLSPSELDSVSGGIAWPILLQAEQYAKQRAELEALYAERAKQGAVGTDDFLRIDQITKAMLDQLKEQVRDVPQTEYVAAKRFLEGLAFEARLPAS